MTYTTLKNLKIGETVEFKEIQDHVSIKQQLIGLGIVPGTVLKLIHRMGNQHIVTMGNSKIALGQTLSHKIIVGRKF